MIRCPERAALALGLVLALAPPGAAATVFSGEVRLGGAQSQGA